MKKTFLVLFLVGTLSTACGKSKTNEIEIQLPTPVASPVHMVAAVPTLGPTLTPTAVPELHYTLEDIKGTVLVSTGDSAVPESAAVGETLDPGEELITKDASEATLALNDDTLVHLTANSHIQLTELTPNNSHGFVSKIELLLGNILSEVEKLDESKSSFEIEAGGVVCGVRGTAFEVEKEGDAVSTNTFHGKVEMKKDGISQFVEKNQHSTFSLKKSGFLPQRVLKPAEKKRYSTWTQKKTLIQQKRALRLANHASPKPTTKNKISVKIKELKKEKPSHTVKGKKPAKMIKPILKKKKDQLKGRSKASTKPRSKRAQAHSVQAKPRANIHPRPQARVAPKAGSKAPRLMAKPQPRKTPPPKKKKKK